ncbi:MAG TPA: hypothetical protein V6D04_09185, partial [Candidatus Obscuribacterales bacterium]
FQSSDLYAVGVLLFELLLGYRPFSGSPGELMAAHLNSPVKIPEAVPNEISQVVLGALQKLPARRFQSAQEMLNATQAAVASLSSRWQLESVPLPLVPASATSLPQCAFRSQEQEPLIAPMAGLSVLGSAAGQWLYRSTGSACNGEVIADKLISTATLPLVMQKQLVGAVAVTEAIHALVVRPQGCFAIASPAIYLLPLDHSIPAASSDGRLLIRRLIELDSDFIAAIEPQGRWFATLAAQPEPTVAITVWRHDRRRPEHPFVPQAAIACPVAGPCQIVALDSRHFAVISTFGNNATDSMAAGVISSSTKSLDNGLQEGLSTGTLITGFTRRGQRLGSWLLPIAVDSVILSAIPYRVLGKQAGCSDSLVLIDLKPLRVRRIKVSIEPTLWTATPWGYILVDCQGQLVLLDEEGQQVGQIAAPTHLTSGSPPATTAIASFNNFGVLLATWHQESHQGHIHTLDLREFDLDMMF